MKVTRKTYGAGRDGAEVVLVVIEGGGHTWPGQEVRRQGARQVDAERLGQRPDVGVLPEAPDTAAGMRHSHGGGQAANKFLPDDGFSPVKTLFLQGWTSAPGGV